MRSNRKRIGVWSGRRLRRDGTGVRMPEVGDTGCVAGREAATSTVVLSTAAPLVLCRTLAAIVPAVEETTRAAPGLPEAG